MLYPVQIVFGARVVSGPTLPELVAGVHKCQVVKWRSKYLNENLVVSDGGARSCAVYLICPPEVVPRFSRENTLYFGQFEHGIRPSKQHSSRPQGRR